MVKGTVTRLCLAQMCHLNLQGVHVKRGNHDLLDPRCHFCSGPREAYHNFRGLQETLTTKKERFGSTCEL